MEIDIRKIFLLGIVLGHISRFSSILSRRHLHDFLERNSKVVRIGDADFVGDVGDGLISIREVITGI